MLRAAILCIHTNEHIDVCVCVRVLACAREECSKSRHFVGAAPPAALPAGWRELVDVNGMIYYHDV